MVTLEARTYGLARHVRRRASARWMIVNDVAGFIGPEVFKEPEQLERACLEDMVMAKLHGLTMGLDVCATFHMGISPSVLRHLTERLVERAAPAYLMAVAGNADPMLGYLTTSFREHPPLRSRVGKRMASPMERRLTTLGAISDGAPKPSAETVAHLYAAYAKAGGDARTRSSLEEEGRRRLHELRERGFDLGALPSAEADARIEAIYAHARHALYAALDEGVIRDASPRSVRVRSEATSRDDYLAHPQRGERVRGDDARRLASLHHQATPCRTG